MEIPYICRYAQLLLPAASGKEALGILKYQYTLPWDEIDDIQVGGNTIDEVLGNWDRILSKLNMNNLKMTAQKVRVLMEDTEVYGFRIKNGHIMPSQHIITNIGDVNIENLSTVKSINSW